MFGLTVNLAKIATPPWFCWSFKIQILL